MAKKLQKHMISLQEGRAELDDYLKKYRAEYVKTSSTDKGQLFWLPANSMWLLVMATKVKKTPYAQLTFHAKDNCPCQII